MNFQCFIYIKSIVAKESQKRANTRNVMVVGEGKLKRLAKYTGGPGQVEQGAFVKKKCAIFFKTMN